MNWFDIKPRHRAHSRLALASIADNIAAGEMISRHSATGENVLPLIELLERRNVPYTLVAVPGVGYLIGRHYPGNDKATKEYAERVTAAMKSDGEAHG